MGVYTRDCSVHLNVYHIVWVNLCTMPRSIFHPTTQSAINLPIHPPSVNPSIHPLCTSPCQASPLFSCLSLSLSLSMSSFYFTDECAVKKPTLPHGGLFWSNQESGTFCGLRTLSASETNRDEQRDNKCRPRGKQFLHNSL